MKRKVDFLPEDYLEKKAQRRTNVVCLFLFLIIVSSVGVGFYLTDQKRQKMKIRIEKINQEMLEASESMKQMDELEQKKSQMLAKAATSATLMEKVPRSLILATITNDLPAGVSLIDYEMSTKEITPTTTQTRSRNKRGARSANKPKPNQTNIPGKVETTMEFTGISANDIEVAQLIENLNQSPLFEQVNLILSEEHKINEELMRRFKIKVYLDPLAQASRKDVELARKMHISGM